MKAIVSVFTYLVFLLILVNQAGIAGGQNRAGTSAAPQLLIPVSARSLGMGGSAVAIASGVESIYWNPAGLDRTESSAEGMFSHRTYIADMAVNYFGVSGKFGIGTIALSLRAFDIGDIPVTTETAPDGTGEIFSPTFFVAGFSYSKRLSDRTSVGATVNVINERFSRVGATGFAFDFGVQYTGVIGIEPLSVGVSVKNVGPPMRYGGSGLFVEAQAVEGERGATFYKVEAGSFDLPSVIEIGLAYDLSRSEVHGASLAGTYQNNNYAYDEYRIGAEYAYKNTFFVRGGYLIGAGVSDRIPHIFENYTIGAGVNLLNIGGVDLQFDYAFVPVKWFESNNVISLKVGF